MTWRVARCLDILLTEINTLAPNRSKVSDGSIGDAAHATRDSDHNPWVTLLGTGIVTARDFTHDPADGLDCNDLAAHLVRMGRDGDPRVKYVIWNRRIISTSWDFSQWRTYSGSNPHDKHLHLSVSPDPDVFDRTGSWGWGEWDQMATRAEVREVVDKALAAFKDDLAVAVEARLVNRLDNGDSDLSRNLRRQVRIAVDNELDQRDLGTQ